MQNTLSQLKIKAEVVEIENTGFVSRYFLQLSPGAKVSKLESCAKEIGLSMRAQSTPIIRLLTDKGLVCVEVLNKKQDLVDFSDLVPTLQRSQEDLPCIFGRTQEGSDLIIDITKTPHLLVAGTTGSGKSVLLHSIILSNLLSNKNVKLALIDPKTVEFSCYKYNKKLAYPIASSIEEANDCIKELIAEMDKRFRKMAWRSATNIKEYNTRKFVSQMPYIVAVIDELSDLMMTGKKQFQTNITRLAQKSRACGIHVIAATQHPSANIITGPIKANFPTRVSCRVTSSVNSRVVLDKCGAEKLLGKGDALLDSPIYDMARFQVAYADSQIIKCICEEGKKGLPLRIFEAIRRKL